MQNKNSTITINKNQIKTNDNIDILNKIKVLEKHIIANTKKIQNLTINSSDDEINRTEKNFNKTTDNLSTMEAIISDKEFDNKMNLQKELEPVQRMYRDLQNIYISKRIELIDKKTQKLDNHIKKSLNNVTEDINKITENLLFSVISILLGISLVTSMITGIEKLDPGDMLPYFVSICWVSIIVLGFAYILIRLYDKKTRFIITSMIIATIVLSLVMIYTYIL